MFSSPAEAWTWQEPATCQLYKFMAQDTEGQHAFKLIHATVHCLQSMGENISDLCDIMTELLLAEDTEEYFFLSAIIF